MSCINFPKPYPDELLFSALARFGRHHLMLQPQQVLQALLGDRTRVPSAILPMRLGPLTAHIRKFWGLGRQDVALDHTLLPYYLIGKPAKTRHEALECVAKDTPGELSKSLGINASRIKQPPHLRYCPTCVAEDRTRFGEAYWHRVHQLPGVLVCPIHSENLRISGASVRPSVRQALVAAEGIVDVVSNCAVRIREVDLTKAEAIAHHSFLLMKRQCVQSDGSVDAAIPMPWQQYLDISGPRELRQLQHDFVGFYGRNLLEILEPGGRDSARVNWLNLLRRTPRRALHPMRWILLDLFLKSFTKRQAPSPFGRGPWKCRNPLAEHYGTPVVTVLERVHDHRHPDRVIGRFRCECGFVFTRTANAGPGYHSHRVVDYGPLYFDKAQALAKQGLSTHAIGKVLNVDWKTANRFLTPEEGKDSENTVIETDRIDWLELIAAHPGEGVKCLRARAPGLYMRLYRRDQGWLKSHSPYVQQSGRGRSRVNWEDRDRAWATALEREAMYLFAKEPALRVTRTLLSRRLGIQASLEKNIARLPRVKKALEQVCESREAYRARRLKSAADDLGSGCPLWKIIRTAGLRPSHVTDNVLNRAGLGLAMKDKNNAAR